MKAFRGMFVVAVLALAVLAVPVTAFANVERCSCHSPDGVSVDDKVNPGREIFFDAYAQATGGDMYSLYPKADLGYICAKDDVVVDFELYASDADEHVCKVGDPKDIYAWMKKATDKLEVEVRKDGKRIASLPLTITQWGDPTFGAKAEWVPPKGADGKMLTGKYTFAYKGRIRDKDKIGGKSGPPVEHKDSLDGSVDVSIFEAELHIIRVEIEEFARVRPRTGNEEEVDVTLAPSPLPDALSVSLSVVRVTGGEGAGDVVDPAGRVITQTTTIKVRGTQQSWGAGNTAAPNNMQLRATLSVHTSPCDTENFTISAKPIKFHQTSVRKEVGGVLKFRYAWESDSGNLNDLDKIWLGEHVTYSDGGKHVGPNLPWKANNPDPTIKPARGITGATTGTGGDTHRPPGGRLPSAGPAASYTATQYYGFRDFRTDPGAVDNTLGWQTNLLGPITISRWVEEVGGNWRYRIEKSGTTHTQWLP